MIFVFGSNLGGLHGGGAAHEAYKHFGATWGQGVGPSGRSYAIPTKNENITASLHLTEIQKHVEDFKTWARRLPNEEFFVTAIGCGLAGYKPEQIAPMFKDAPPNCTLHRRLVAALAEVA